MRTAPRPTGSAPAFARWLWLNCPGFLKHPVISRFFMRGTGSPIWDIPYKNGDSLTSADAERCSLDLYLPSSRVGFPTLVWFHGGGFIEGHKSELTALKLASRFCRGGVAAATVGYRLSPTVTYPAYIEDGASALAWVYGNIDRLGGDSSKIFVSGHSAGAYLAALIALDSRYLARHGLGTDSVAGLIVISGQMGTHTHVRKELGLSNQELIVDRAAPLFHVGSASPPVLCICGALESPERADEIALFVNRLRAAGNPTAELCIVEGRNHGTIVSNISRPADVVAKRMLSFIRRSAR